MDTQIDNSFLEILKNQPTLPYQKVLPHNSYFITKDHDVINSNKFIFNNDLDLKLPITDQKSSGRCWIFAGLNLVRALALNNWIGTLDIGDLEFSQTYLYFWDKFERYHRNLRYYLDIMSIEDNFKRNQYLMQLNKDPLGDGGQWSMIGDLIKKYGIVPKSIMPDTFHSKNSGNMNTFLTTQLKQDFWTLSKSSKEVHEELIQMMMTRIYNYLVGFLGKPPVKFDWWIKSKNNKVDSLCGMTPLSLLSKSNFNPDDYISIVNDPRKEHPFEKKYEIKYLGNVKAKHVSWINLDISRVKELCQKSIDNKQPVWFGCDVGAEHDRDTGIHDIGIYNTQTFMNHKITMSKEEKLKYYASVPSHAMVIVGYHIENDKIKRWKIENSWGSSSGTSGFQLMSDKWFDEYVYQIVVHKDLLSDKEKEILLQEPLIIEPWDPLGTLA